MRFSRLTAVFVLLLVPVSFAVGQTTDFPFSWDQATVYQVITDRFSNGDSGNDGAYGRGLDGNGSPYAIDSTGHFLGGDFSGLQSWIEEDYFNDLGVNVLWISAPYEQIHGWVGGGSGEFQHYAYHGYWPLDFTEVDKAFGSKEDFASLVDSAHEKGIRVVLDVVLNHVGYATLDDMAAFDFGGLTDDNWRDWRPASKVGWQSYNDRFLTYADSSDAWQRWWGPDWVRSDLPGYEPCGSDEYSECVHMLPDIRDDIAVRGLPAHLMLKWGADKSSTEQASLDSFFERTRLQRTAANHVIKWLSDWVGEFGIDGFRLDTAKHIAPETLNRLKTEATLALSTWKEANPEKALDDSDFWMTGEVFGHGLEPSAYFDHGLDSVLNFDFQTDIQAQPETHFSSYAEQINTNSSFNVLSFISSHDTSLHDRSDLMDAGTRLMLSPGGVVLFYGDESARPLGAGNAEEVDRTRSLMNWATVDEEVHAHWKKLGSFRAAHPAIATGGHDQLQDEPYAFYRGARVGAEEDQVIVVLGAEGRTRLNVSVVWPDDTVLRDAYTGKISIVSFGQITLNADPSGVMLLEEVK